MRPWTQSDRLILAQMYSEKKPPDAIAKILNRTTAAIRRRAIIEGLSSEKHSRTWHSSELAILESYGSIPFKRVYARLKGFWKAHSLAGRSESAVQRKISELGYSLRLDTDYYSLRQISQALRCSHQIPYGWLKDKEMKQILKPKGELVHRDNLREFIRKFPGEIAKCAPDILWLLSVVFKD